MITNNTEDLIPSALFTRILLQSGRYSSSNPQQPVLQSDAEKLLINFASLFAQELVSKSSSVAQRRIETSSSTSINKNDVNFVLKHQWPIYDSSSYNQTPKN
jgi:histone H3/H4